MAESTAWTSVAALSRRAVTFLSEVRVDRKVSLVKGPRDQRVWYTRRMNRCDASSVEEERETCAAHPMGRAIRLLGDAPTLLIICTLLHGTQRFGELHAAVGDVSTKTVSHRLKALEELGFVRRQAFAEIPPRVEYCLTESGLALADIMEAIKQFGERYLAGQAAAATATDALCAVDANT
jgi:DNA-binding HxlR family transcriptional regulator